MTGLLTPARFRILAVLYAILVITVSSWPSLRTPDLGFSAQDKVLHAVQYLIFALLVTGGWGGANRWSRWIVLIGILIAFAAADEFHQRWIPGRDPDTLDWVADAIGSLAGGLALVVGRRWLPATDC